METFTKNPGLQQISEDIFRCLDKKSLLNCRLVNHSWKEILDMPIFCLKNFNSSEVVENWKFLAQQIEDEELAKKFSLILTKMEKSKPIYPLEMVIKLKKVGKYPDVMKFILEHEKTHSTVSVHCITPIHLAASYGLTQSVERLRDKYDSPIDYIESSDGSNPIHYAAYNGHLEIVIILAKFTDVPNAVDNNGSTPIHYAAFRGHFKIVKFLTNLTDDPNIPNNDEITPIHYAAFNGHLKTVKFLVHLTDVSNAPDNFFGNTPMEMAKANGHTQVVKFLEKCLTNFPALS